jgi:hypothetical protein
MSANNSTTTWSFSAVEVGVYITDSPNKKRPEPQRLQAL